jgi:cell division protein FtsB
MVSRPRLRSFFTALCLYLMASLLIGYFWVNAFTGNRGLDAKKDLDLQIGELSAELGRVKTDRAQWQRRVALLKADKLDPDMLDERARALLNYVDRRDLIMILRKP